MKMARLLQGLTLFLLLWTLLALLGWLAWGFALWLLLGMLLLALLHAPLMGLEFLLLRWAGRHDAAPRPGAWEMLRAWAAEAAGAVSTFGWQIAWRSKHFEDHVPADARGRRGLILVHGFV